MKATPESNKVLVDALSAAEKHYKNGFILLDSERMEIAYCSEMVKTLVNHTTLSTPDYSQILDHIASVDQAYVQQQIQYMFVKKCSGKIEFSIKKDKPESPDTVICCSIYFLSPSDYVILLIDDITKNKAYEGYLIEFGTKKQVLLETMTHHFSGALALMQQLSRQAEQTIGDNYSEQHLKYLQLLKANTESCIVMMEKLLSEEQIKAPEIEVKIYRLNIVERISYIYETLIKAFPSRRISFDTVAPFIYVYSDELKVLQIINNFISNAIKFTPVDKQISISIYQTGNNAIISIQDEGLGIPERLQPFLFKKRNASGRPGLSGQPSHGHGLHISKTLADSMNARIEYQSEEGKGSIFYLLIPTKPADNVF